MNAQLRHLRLVLDSTTRRQVETIVERLIAFLDDVDGDAYLEPCLGAPENHKPLAIMEGGWWRTVQPDQRRWTGEAANDDREADDDEEPSMGWTRGGRYGGGDGREAEHDGREPEEG